MFEQEIERYERVRKDYEARIKAKMSPTDYMDWHEVLFSTHSCGIEGNSFTVDDTRILKEQGLAMVPVGRIRSLTVHLVPFPENIRRKIWWLEIRSSAITSSWLPGFLR